MNIEDGKLSADDHELVERWLNEKQAFRPCSACGNTTWTLLNHVLNGSIFTPGQLIISGISYPMIGLSCNRCAYVRMHSAIVIGVVKEDGLKPEVERHNG